MTEPPELWAFVASNLLVLLVGSVLAALSVTAYRRNGNRAFLLAAASFTLILFGSLLEAVYELGIRGSYELPGRELLLLHTVESLLLGAGLAVLFYSLKRY